MAERDFERSWLAKLAAGVETQTGIEVCQDVMRGSDGLSDASSRRQIIRWTARAMLRLDELVEAPRRQEIMLGCACHYPSARLGELAELYARTGDLDLVHQGLQEQFTTMLRDALGLDETMIAEIVGRGWGSAGLRRGRTIVATKIPKSGNLVEYMRETDPHKKRALYCHCPRIRQAIADGGAISPTYCYCGAGFYKNIWEEILRKPVEVQLLRSLLAGDDVCSFELRLPD